MIILWQKRLRNRDAGVIAVVAARRLTASLW